MRAEGFICRHQMPAGWGCRQSRPGTVTGLATVTSPFTYLMGNGGLQDLIGANQWTTVPMNGFPDGDYFTDPFAGLPQPPAPTGLPDHPVPGGLIAGSLLGAPTVLPPGNYYATLPILGTPTGTPSDAGEIFIFTSGQYPGLVMSSALANSGLSFPQVQAGLMAGVEPQITLHGLNKNSPNLPAALANYAPVLIWQDRANTTLKYTSNGLLDLSCGGICSNILSVPGSQEMVLMASQNGGNAGTNLYGTIYGPRGSWLTILGVLSGDTVAGPLQIISRALQMTLNASLNVNPLPNPPSKLIAGLIQ